MARGVVDAVRARGSLAVDPQTIEDGASWPERILAWDEDETTLAIEAASHLPRASVAVVGPGIDAETFRVARDVALVFTASDPMAIAKSMTGAVLAVGCPPGTHSAIAALVDEARGAVGSGPRDISPAPRMISAMRALQESRVVPPSEPMPDTPMGAYVPLGTWNEDLAARLRLVAQRCVACKRVQYPPRGACVSCRGSEFEDVQLPRDAKVYTMTRIGRGGAPSEFALEQAQVGAFWVGIVEWPAQDLRVIARLAGYDEQGPAIGDAVRATVRRLFVQEGRARYGIKFAQA